MLSNGLREVVAVVRRPAVVVEVASAVLAASPAASPRVSLLAGAPVARLLGSAPENHEASTNLFFLR